MRTFSACWCHWNRLPYLQGLFRNIVYFQHFRLGGRVNLLAIYSKTRASSNGCKRLMQCTMPVLTTGVSGYCKKPSVFYRFIYLYILCLHIFYLTFGLHVFPECLISLVAIQESLWSLPCHRQHLQYSSFVISHFILSLRFEHVRLGYLSQPPTSLTGPVPWYPIHWRWQAQSLYTFPSTIGLYSNLL